MAILWDENAQVKPNSKESEWAASFAEATKDAGQTSGDYVIWPCNEEQLMKSLEEPTFSHSMKTDWKATVGAFNKVTATKEKRYACVSK